SPGDGSDWSAVTITKFVTPRAESDRPTIVIVALAPVASVSKVSDLRQSRRLEIVNRSKRVNLGAAQSGFGLRTVPTDPGVGLPSLALGYRDARQLHCVPRSRPNSPAPRSAGPRSSFASLHRSAQCGWRSCPSYTPSPAIPSISAQSRPACAHDRPSGAPPRSRIPCAAPTLGTGCPSADATNRKAPCANTWG